MKSAHDLLKSYIQDEGLEIKAYELPALVQYAKEYHAQFEQPWQSIDTLTENDNSKDILLIARECDALRVDGKALFLGKYWHGVQQVTIGVMVYNIDKFKVWMPTDHLLP